MIETFKLPIHLILIGQVFHLLPFIWILSTSNRILGTCESAVPVPVMWGRLAERKHIPFFRYADVQPCRSLGNAGKNGSPYLAK